MSRNTSGSGGVFGGLIIASKGSLRTETAPLNPKKGGGPTTPQEGEGNTETPGYPGAVDVAWRRSAKLLLCAMVPIHYRAELEFRAPFR